MDKSDQAPDVMPRKLKSMMGKLKWRKLRKDKVEEIIDIFIKEAFK